MSSLDGYIPLLVVGLCGLNESSIIKSDSYLKCKDSKSFLFALAEYARITFVGDILTRLGFVAPEKPEEAATIRKRALRQLRGHRQNLTNSLRTLANMLSGGFPSQPDMANGAPSFRVAPTHASSNFSDSHLYTDPVPCP